MRPLGIKHFQGIRQCDMQLSGLRVLNTIADPICKLQEYEVGLFNYSSITYVYMNIRHSAQHCSGNWTSISPSGHSLTGLEHVVVTFLVTVLPSPPCETKIIVITVTSQPIDTVVHIDIIS